MKTENPLFTTTEAAAYLGITRSYLYKLMIWHKVPYYKPRGKLCFFDKADLDEYNRRQIPCRQYYPPRNLSTSRHHPLRLRTYHRNRRCRQSTANFLEK